MTIDQDIDGEADASARNKAIIEGLVRLGEAVGLETEREVPTLGARIDVVWFWRGTGLFERRVPVVAFEVESSWRTRKHIKADLLNLLDFQPGVGVIVLAGSGPKVEATRRFAKSMTASRPCRVEVWTGNEAIAAITGNLALFYPDPATVASAASTSLGHVDVRRILVLLEESSDVSVSTTIGELEELLGRRLPTIARKAGYWESAGNPTAAALQAAGWSLDTSYLSQGRLAFRRTARGVR